MNEKGMTIVELLIAMSLLLIAAAIFGTALSTSFTVTKDFEGVAASNDSARLALKQIDRELRSAESIAEPLPCTASNTLDFVTRAYTGSEKTQQHIVYELVDGALRRSADGGSMWRTVIDDVVNESTEPLFETQGAAGGTPSEGKVVTITIWTDADPTDRIARRLAETEVSGRNIWTPKPGGSCP
jgi:prepilin-type N-terminal cleavage/methylation domain-containing protein